MKSLLKTVLIIVIVSTALFHSLDTSGIATTLFWVSIFFFLANFGRNKITPEVINSSANIAQIVIALCAIRTLLPHNTTITGFYGISEDRKVKVITRAEFGPMTDVVILDPLFTTKIELLLPTKQTFYINEISSTSSLETYPELELTHLRNKVTFSLMGVDKFCQLIEEGFKKRFYVKLLSKMPGTKVVITIEDTYGYTHLIRPLKNIKVCPQQI
jgi:hypothetical protein